MKRYSQLKSNTLLISPLVHSCSCSYSTLFSTAALPSHLSTSSTRILHVCPSLFNKFCPHIFFTKYIPPHRLLYFWTISFYSYILSTLIYIDINACFCLFGFLMSSSATRLYRGRVPRLKSDNFKCCHTRDRAGRQCLLSQPVIFNAYGFTIIQIQ